MLIPTLIDLDNVLKYYAFDNVTFPTLPNELSKSVIIQKLIKDKFISQTITAAGNKTTTSRCITFEGLLFANDGGYSTNVRRKLLSNLTTKTNLTLCLFGLWGATIGTTGLLYFEYLKYNHHNPYGLTFWKIMLLPTTGILVLLPILFLISYTKNKNKPRQTIPDDRE